MEERIIEKGQFHGEENAIYEIWKECFQDTEEYMQFYFKNKARKNRILTLLDKKKPISMVHLNPYQLSINGKVWDSAYIVGVATKESYRKKGCMRTLLSQSLRDLYEEHCPMTYLMPASESIYTPFDFRFIYKKHRMDGYVENIGKKRNEQISITEWEMEKEPEVVVAWVNEQLLRKYTIFPYRTVDYYQCVTNEMKACYGNVSVVRKEGKIKGVILYTREENRLEFIESILDRKEQKEILHELLLYLQVDNSTVTFYESGYLDQEAICSNMRILSEYEKPMIMGRIVNVESFLSTLRVKERLDLVIGVKDSILTDNIGNYRLLSKKDASITVTRTEKKPSVVMDVADWMTFFVSDELERERILFMNGCTSEKVGSIVHNLGILNQSYINEIV